MSTKPWQKQNAKSAFLMAKWLFGKADALQPKPPEEKKSSGEVPKSLPDDKADESSQLPKDEDPADVDPAELVECWYSGDEQDDEDPTTEVESGGGEKHCCPKFRGHRMGRRPAKKTRKIQENVLEALSTIG